MLGGPIGLEHVRYGCGQCAAYDLLDTTGVQVYARAKTRHGGELSGETGACRGRYCGVRTEIRNFLASILSVELQDDLELFRYDYGSAATTHNGTQPRETEAHKPRGA
jgi:hypothetical protein